NTSRTHLPYALAALVAVFLTGIVLAVADDLVSLGTAIGAGSKLNAPGPLFVVQIASGITALVAPRRIARIAAAVLVAACTLSLAAAAFDGDVGAAELSTGQVAFQLLIVAITAITWLGAARVWSRARPST